MTNFFEKSSYFRCREQQKSSRRVNYGEPDMVKYLCKLYEIKRRQYLITGHYQFYNHGGENRPAATFAP